MHALLGDQSVAQAGSVPWLQASAQFQPKGKHANKATRFYVLMGAVKELMLNVL